MENQFVTATSMMETLEKVFIFFQFIKYKNMQRFYATKIIANPHTNSEYLVATKSVCL